MIKILRNIFLVLILALRAGFSAAAATNGIQSAGQPSSMRLGAGRIELSVNVDHPVTFSIYAITGQMVKSVTVDAGESATVELPKGVYIVKCDHWAKQVVVR